MSLTITLSRHNLSPYTCHILTHAANLCKSPVKTAQSICTRWCMVQYMCVGH